MRPIATRPAVLLVLLALAVAGLVAYVAIRAEARRREALRALGRRLGLSYSPERDPSLPRRYRFLDRLDEGFDRPARHGLEGELEGHRVRGFEYHHSTQSSSGKQTHTQHHQLAVFVLDLPRRFPELTLRREGLLSKIAQAVGFDDIDFESHEFSRRFCVRAEDKRSATCRTSVCSRHRAVDRAEGGCRTTDDAAAQCGRALPAPGSGGESPDRRGGGKVAWDASLGKRPRRPVS